MCEPKKKKGDVDSIKATRSLWNPVETDKVCDE